MRTWLPVVYPAVTVTNTPRRLPVWLSLSEKGSRVSKFVIYQKEKYRSELESTQVMEGNLSLPQYIMTFHFYIIIIKIYSLSWGNNNSNNL